jgi:uncharacterized protein (TIGR02391 family)
LHLLPIDVLDPALVAKALPDFENGNFDLAVFAAFREVEVRIRDRANLTPTDIGTALARKAFDVKQGPLTDLSNPDGGEKQAYSDLFSGALGAFKNPSSHRIVNYDDPNIAASLILFANTLLAIIDQRASSRPSTAQP